MLNACEKDGCVHVQNRFAVCFEFVYVKSVLGLCAQGRSNLRHIFFLTYDRDTLIYSPRFQTVCFRRQGCTAAVVRITLQILIYIYFHRFEHVAGKVIRQRRYAIYIYQVRRVNQHNLYITYICEYWRTCARVLVE